MKITKYPLVALLGILFIVVSGAAAHADTTYTYSGNPFTDFTGAAGCSQPSTGQESSDTCSISGFFTVGQPLAANLFDAQVSPTDWNFTNGFGVWNPGGFVLFAPSSSTFVISTDSNGNITNWAISLVLSGTNPQNTPENIILFTNNGEDFTETQLVGVGVFDEASNAGVPGAWTMTTIGSGGGGTGGGGTTVTPEPSTLILVATPILVLAACARWKKAAVWRGDVVA